LADPRQTTRATLFGDTDQTKRPAAEMGAIAGAGFFAGADGVRGLWGGLHGGALPLQTTPPKAGGPLETGVWVAPIDFGAVTTATARIGHSRPESE
jgi:hypothetical protein